MKSWSALSQWMFAFAASTLGLGAVAQVNFEKVYCGLGNTTGGGGDKSIVSSDGHLYIHATHMDMATVQLADVIIKERLDGQTVWQRRFASGGAGHALREAPDGSLVFATSIAPDTVLLARIDTSGALVEGWRIGAPQIGARDMRIDADGNVYLLCGGLKIMKITSSGNFVWGRSYGPSGIVAFFMELRPGGELSMASTVNFTTLVADRIDTNGTWLSSKAWSAPGVDPSIYTPYRSKLLHRANGKMVLLVQCMFTDPYATYLKVLSVDSLGAIEWQRILGPADIGFDAELLPDQSVLIMHQGGKAPGFLARITSDGTFILDDTRRIADEFGHMGSLTLLPDGGAAVTGDRTDPFGGQEMRPFLIRFGPSFESPCVNEPYDPTETELEFAPTDPPVYTIVPFSATISPVSLTDTLLLDVALVCGSTAISSTTGNSITIGPNPADEMVRCSGPHGPLEVTITDALGKVMLRTTVRHEEDWIPLTKLPNGLYFVHFNGPDGSGTRRLIVAHP